MSENRDTRAIFSASHCTDEFASIHAGHMFLQSAFQFGFLWLNRCSLIYSLAWNSLYNVENPNLLVCRSNSPPINQSFSSVLLPEVYLKLIIIFTRTVLPRLCFFS